MLAVLIGAAVQGTRANFLLGTDPTDRFYADTFTLINVVLVVAVVLSAAGLLVTASEGVVERRRTLAALRAGGMPRRTLAAAILAETLLPLVPVIAAATIAGLMASRGLFGSSVNAFDAVNGTSSTLVAVPIPWLRLMVLAGGAVATSTLVTAGSLALLGPSSDPTELRAAA
ncbi:MAG: FtsX-like permease family protein [Ilumatobacteraceae bacterium]